LREVVYLYNQDWIEIRNLEITNYKAGDKIEDSTSFKRALYILGENFGGLEHIYLLNLNIHNVNGFGIGENTRKDNGGIFFEIREDTKPSWFNDFLVEDCYLYDVTRTVIGLMPNATNDSCTIRYNILQDNHRQTFRFSGPVYNAKVYNNTIHIGPEVPEFLLLGIMAEWISGATPCL